MKCSQRDQQSPSILWPLPGTCRQLLPLARVRVRGLPRVGVVVRPLPEERRPRLRQWMSLALPP